MCFSESVHENNKASITLDWRVMQASYVTIIYISLINMFTSVTTDLLLKVTGSHLGIVVFG